MEVFTLIHIEMYTIVVLFPLTKGLGLMITQWNTSVLSVVELALTLSIAGHICPPGGCFPNIPDPSAASATFFWSNLADAPNSSACDEDLYSYAEEKGLEVCCQS